MTENMHYIVDTVTATINRKYGDSLPTLEQINEEAEVIRKAFNVLYPVSDDDFVQIAKNVAQYHHEKWNGTGYPNQVKGTDIPLCARIISAADVLDALLSKRPYKEGYDIDKAFEIITPLAGVQFDPDIISILPKIKDDVAQIAQDETGRLAEKYASLA